MLSIYNNVYDIRALVFDKDGTLLNINHLWSRVAKQWVAEILAQTGADARLAQAIAQGIGLDEDGNLIPNGPIAVASTWKVTALVSGVLYQYGLPWEQADTLAQQVVHGDYAVAPDLIEAVGDVAGTLTRLHAAGVKLAVATSDHRAPTLATLPILGIDHLIDVIVCGDDPLPNKPSPAVFEHISDALGIAPAHIAMVGDSDGDMLTGKNGGGGLAIGVTGGGGDPTATADVCVESVDALQFTLP